MNSNIASSEIILHPCCLKEINTPFSIQHCNSVNFIFSLIYLKQSDLMVKCKQMFFFPWGLEIKLKFPEGQILLLFMTVSPLCKNGVQMIFLFSSYEVLISKLNFLSKKIRELMYDNICLLLIFYWKGRAPGKEKGRDEERIEQTFANWTCIF